MKLGRFFPSVDDTVSFFATGGRSILISSKSTKFSNDRSVPSRALETNAINNGRHEPRAGRWSIFARSFLRLMIRRPDSILAEPERRNFHESSSPMESAFLTCTVSSSFFSALKSSTVSINGSVLLDSTSLRAHLNLFGRSLWSLRSFTDTEFYFPTWCAQNFDPIHRSISLLWLNPPFKRNSNRACVPFFFFFFPRFLLLSSLDHRIRLSSASRRSFGKKRSSLLTFQPRCIAEERNTFTARF